MHIAARSHPIAGIASRVRSTLDVIFARLVLVVITSAVFLLGSGESLAQSTDSGVVTGRVFNSRTSEYVRNAEITIEGTNFAAVTEAGGEFRIAHVPAGTVTLVVSYAGFGLIRKTVVVEPGQTASIEIELLATGAPSEDGMVELAEYVVSTEVEGNAKAMMNQRNSMNLGTSIASDVFGDVTEGNVGEFLKYLPGVEMEYVEADTRGPRLGGLNPEYTGVSLDGMKSASADGFIQYGSTENGATGAGGRAFGFEQVSINSIESIEIYRITPANLDADAPAGTIDLRSKRAFDRKGQEFRYALSFGLNSEEFTLGKSMGPGDDLEHKIKPTVSLNYANSFMNNRLGVILGYSLSNLYNEQYRVEHVTERTPSATDPRPQVITQLNLKDGPKWTERASYTLNLDFKATDDLIFALTAAVNTYGMEANNHTVTLRASANTTSGTNGRSTVGGDGVTSIYASSMTTASASNRLVGVGGGNITKTTDTYTFTPRFEYRLGDLRIEGALGSSWSINNYGSLRRGVAGNGAVNNVTGINFEATRPSAQSSAWTITQTGGADWSNVANYTNPRVTDDVRYVYNEINTARLDLSYNLGSRFPTVIKAGAKMQQYVLESHRDTPIQNFAYIGPGGGTTGNFGAYSSAWVFEPRALGVTIRGLNGAGAPGFADRDALGREFREHPEYFSQTATPTNYWDAKYSSIRDMQEDVAAAYLMANVRIGKLTLQGGLRWEDTEVTANEFDPLSEAEVRAVGFPWDNVNNRANSIPGLDYQYTTNPKVDRVGTYDRLFPSLAAKYRITENLLLDIGAGSTIRRPPVTDLQGLLNYNDEAMEIRTSNPNLLPEYADRVIAAMSYYFGGSNSFTVAASETHIENSFETTEVSAPEFGITDPAYADYDVITKFNVEGKIRYRSLEFSYRHMLDFLPHPLDGTSVFATYTRTYVDTRKQGVTPHVITGGFDYRYKRFGFGLKGVWVDDAEWTSTVGRYRLGNLKLDASMEYRFSSRLTVFVQGRNITGEDHHIYEEIGGNARIPWRMENYGSNYVFGVRGAF